MNKLKAILIVIFTSALLSGCYDKAVHWNSSDKLDNEKFIKYYEQCSSVISNHQEGVLTGEQFGDCLRQAYNLSYTP